MAVFFQASQASHHSAYPRWKVPDSHDPGVHPAHSFSLGQGCCPQTWRGLWTPSPVPSSHLTQSHHREMILLKTLLCSLSLLLQNFVPSKNNNNKKPFLTSSIKLFMNNLYHLLQSQKPFPLQLSSPWWISPSELSQSFTQLLPGSLKQAPFSLSPL